MPKNPITPADRHAERYRLRTEPWDAAAVHRELVRRIEEATGLPRPRCHELAHAHGGRFGVSLDGDLIPPLDDKHAADPFQRTVQRVRDTIDVEGQEPELRSVGEIATELRKKINYGM